MPTKGPTLKRIAIKLVVFLLLGAVTTVAVAWGCAANARPLTRNPLAYGGQKPLPENLVQWWYEWGQPTGEVLVTQPHTINSRHVLWGHWSEGGVSQHVLFARSESLFRSALRNGPAAPNEVLRIRECGWPFRAMRDSVWLGKTDIDFTPLTSSVTFHHSLVLAAEHEPAATVRVLPLKVIPLGFLGNVVIYAAAWWMLVRFVIGLRDVRRFRRGCCPACAYERHGDYTHCCPECGWRRKGVAST